MVSGYVIGILSYLSSTIVLWLYSGVGVIVVLLCKWLLGYRGRGESRIRDMCYCESSFGCIVVMVYEDGEWRPATGSDIVHLPVFR